MKNLSFILLFTLLGIGNIQAQDIDIMRDNSVIADDIHIVLYVSDGCGNIVGITDPIHVNWAGVQNFDYNSLSWMVDPDPCGTTYMWTFTEADIYNCIGTQTTGSTACSMGFYDWVHCVSGHCGGSLPVCFEYSSAVCLGHTGVVITADMHSAGPCSGTSNLDLHQ